MAVLRLVLLSWTRYHLRIRSRDDCSPSCAVTLDALSPTGPVGTWLFSELPVKLDALSPTGPVGTWLFSELSCKVGRFITYGPGRDMAVLRVVL